MPEAVTPGRRGLALGLSGLLGVLVILVVRGNTSEYGLLVRADESLLLRDAAALLLGALAVGVFAPLIAGNHMPGLPARALCVAWAGVAVSVRAPEDATTILTQGLWRGVALAEVLVLLAALWLTTTACWLVDTRVTFPRLYPDPADRPPAKHTTPRDVITSLFPHAALVAVTVGAIRYVLPDMADATLPPFILAFAAALLARSVQRLRPSPGSIWTAAGVLGGIAFGTWFRTPDTDFPLPDDQLAAFPAHLLSCALATYAAVIARGPASAPTSQAGEDA